MCGVHAAFGAVIHGEERVVTGDVGLDRHAGAVGVGLSGEDLRLFNKAGGDDLQLGDLHSVVAEEADVVVLAVVKAEITAARHDILQIFHHDRVAALGEVDRLVIFGVDVHAQAARSGVVDLQRIAVRVADHHVVELHDLFAVLRLGGGRSRRAGGHAARRSLADGRNLRDAQPAAAIGDQLDLLLERGVRRNGRIRGLRHHIAHDLPLGDGLSGHLDLDRRILYGKRLQRNFIRHLYGEGGGRVIRVDHQTVVPFACRIDLVVGEPLVELRIGVARTGVVRILHNTPVLFHLDGIGQRSAVHNDRVVVPGGGAHFHRELCLHHVAGLPLAFDGEEAVDHIAADRCAVHLKRRGLAPLGDAQLEREGGGVAAVCNGDVAVERVVGLLAELRGLAARDGGRHAVGAVGDHRHAAVHRGHPHVLYKFRPTHVHVGEAALVARRCAEGEAVAVFLQGLVRTVGRQHLILGLVVVVAGEIRGVADRQRVVGEMLQLVAQPAFAENPHADRIGKDALHHRAGLGAAVGVVLARQLVRIGETVHAAVVDAQVEQALAQRVAVAQAARHLIDDRRSLHTLGGVDHMLANGGVGELIRPLVGGCVERIRQVDQPFARFGVRGIVDVVIVPQHDLDVVAAARRTPAAELRFLLLLITKILFEEVYNPLIGLARIHGRLVVIAQNLHHHHAGPPVGVGLRAKEAVEPLGGQQRVNPLLRLRLELVIIQHPGQGGKAPQVIGPLLPVVAAAAAPGAGFAVDGEVVMNVAGKPVLLQIKLLQEPVLSLDRAHRQLCKWSFLQLALVEVIVENRVFSRAGTRRLSVRRQGAARHSDAQDYADNAAQKIFLCHTFTSLSP